MAFTSGSATNQEDLIQQLFTFATANGWTQDELNLTDNEASLHKDNVFVHFRWQGNESGGPNNIAMYQSLGFTPGNNAWEHPDDSGSGSDMSELDFSRRISGIGDGPFTAHHFFLGTNPDYIYGVLEYTPGIYRHFGFGEIEKIGDWTGGEWCGAHVWAGSGQEDDPTSVQHSVLFDGAHQSFVGDFIDEAATFHMEGLPNQAASKWANVGDGAGAAGQDRGGASRSRVMGAFRGGQWINMFGWFAAQTQSAFIPLIPISVIYKDNTPSPDDLRLLGFVPNVRQMQMTHFNPGDTFTVGTDTWRVFPAVRKRNAQDNQEESRDMGIAYLQVP